VNGAFKVPLTELVIAGRDGKEGVQRRLGRRPVGLGSLGKFIQPSIGEGKLHHGPGDAHEDGLVPASHPVPVHIIDEPPPFIVPEVDHRHVAFADGVGFDAAVEHEVSNRIEGVIPVQAVLEHGASIVHDLVKVEGDGVRGKVVRPILHDYGEPLFRLFFDVLEELVFPFHWRSGDGQAVRNDQHAIGIEGVRTEFPFGFEGYGEDFFVLHHPTIRQIVENFRKEPRKYGISTEIRLISGEMFLLQFFVNASIEGVLQCNRRTL